MKIIASHLLVMLLGFLIGWWLYFPQSQQLHRASDSTAECNTILANDDGGFIDSLSRMLMDAQAQIAKLQKDNDQLSLLSTSYQDQLTALLSQPSFRKKIAAMDKSQLQEKLNYVVATEDMEGITDLHQFANRLMDLALNAGPTNIENPSVSINVSMHENYSDGFSNYLEVEEHQRLYAHFMSSEPVDKVFVKWQNLSTGETLLFKRMGLRPGQNVQKIGMVPHSGWKQGEYQVSLFVINDDLNPLGTHVYTIGKVNEDSVEYQPPQTPEYTGGKQRRSFLP